jgi:hypothetical protein
VTHFPKYSLFPLTLILRLLGYIHFRCDSFQRQVEVGYVSRRRIKPQGVFVLAGDSDARLHLDLALHGTVLAAWGGFF